MQHLIVKLIRNFIALIILFSWQVQGVISTDDPDDDTLFVGVESDRYPLVFFDPFTFKLTGFDVEYAEELCKKMHRKCQLVVASYTDLINMISDERVDVLVASLNETHQHLDKMVMSKPYYFSHSILICRFPIPEQIDAYMLKNFSMGIKEGSKQQEDLRKVLKRSEIKDVVSFPSYRNMFNALLGAKIDCIYADSHTGYDLIKTASEADSQRVYFSANIEFVRREFNKEKIAVRKSDAAFLDQINHAIDEINEDGTHQRLSLKYFPFTAY